MKKSFSFLSNWLSAIVCSAQIRVAPFLLFCSFLGLISCDQPTGEIEDTYPPSGWADVYIIEIDSTVTCCGIDSFTIKSPWIQDHVNTLIADTTKKYDLPTDLTIEHYIDSNNQDFFIEQYSWDRNRLYDCEGNILEEKEGYYVIELPKDAQEYKMIVEVSIGRFPNI